MNLEQERVRFTFIFSSYNVELYVCVLTEWSTETLHLFIMSQPNYSFPCSFMYRVNYTGIYACNLVL